MVRAGIHHRLARKQLVGFCKSLTWNGVIFRGKESWPKIVLKLRLQFTGKFCRKGAMCNYEIWNHQKACATRERRKLIYLNLHITTRSRLCRWPLTCLMNSKEASGKACEISLKFGLHGSFSNSANMDRPSCYVWNVCISFSNLHFGHIEGVATHYQTLQWIHVTSHCK